MSDTEEKAVDADAMDETEDTCAANGEKADDGIDEKRESATVEEEEEEDGKLGGARMSADDSDSENDETEELEDDSDDEEEGSDDGEDQEDDQGGSSDDDDDEGEEVDQDGSSSSDEDDQSSSDEDEDTHGPAHIAEDGRELSAYEIMRLERIKRNREKLAMLGLQGKEGGGVLGKKPADPSKKSSKKERSKSPTQKRSSLSRRSKAKSVNYAEPPTSVASLLKANKAEKKKAAKDNPKKPPSERKSKDRSERMDKWIHLEFKRLKGQKTQCLKQAKRYVRLAERELKYWKGRAEKLERKQQRKQEAEKVVKEFERERDVLGKTSKELLQEIDSRMPELIDVAERYDNKFEAAAKRQEREERRIEAENKMKTIDALERFPKAMKDAISVLNAVLLERAPKDPPPPRRSKRGAEESPPQTPKKKKQKTQASKKASNDSNGLCNLPSALELSQEDDELPENDQAEAKRKRNVRNVGGWISPNLAQELDRSWLDRDNPPENFDPSTYVPQIGDTVLYYPSGHQAFLSSFPDILGKKTRSVMRTPLWERASAEKEKLAEADESAGDAASAKVWWTDKWLAGIESEVGHYPLVCRVKGTHAEFPPDRFTKVIRNGQVFWKEPKDGKAPDVNSSAQLRLAVTLQPLTHVLPPSWSEKGPSTDDSLALPPTFCVVTFPSRLEPFLIPFAWAYSSAHSLLLDQAIEVRGQDSSRARINNFASVDGIIDSFRFDDKFAAIQNVLTQYGSGSLTKFNRGRVLSESSCPLPLSDVYVVLETFERYVQDRGQQAGKVPSDHSIDIVELVQCTLPLWDSASIMKNVYDRKKRWISPWNLVPVGKLRQVGANTPYRLAEASRAMDQGLRMKIECVIEDFVTENPSAEAFYWPVSEDEAPSYHCAVPIGMSFQKVVERLSLGKSANQRCYYRSVEALLSDIGSIVDNCLLYNSPDSELVEVAVHAVTRIKKEISRIAQDHFREINEARKADEERRLLVMRYCETSPTGNASAETEATSSSKAASITTIRHPYREDLDRDWLQRTRPLGDQVAQESPTASRLEGPSAWIPQAGDRIFYSDHLHARFVKGHYRSLEQEQCMVPRFGTSEHCADDDADSSDVGEDGEAADVPAEWRLGTIVWVRASFPKAPSKTSGDDALTFPTNASLLAIGVQFEDNGSSGQNVHVVYWRPCTFDIVSGEDSGSCPRCGVCYNGSFIRPASSPIATSEAMNSQGTITTNSSLSAADIESINRCFGLLKRRCLRGVPPGYVDHQLTKQTVKRGYHPAQPKVGARSLPSFEYLMEQVPPAAAKDDSVGTRGISIRPKTHDDSIQPLIDAGFLPSWVSGSPGIADSDRLRRHEMIVPCPKLCLELIQIRLKNGYYRQRAAIENDVIEAYASCVFSLMAEAGGRKKSPVSIRRVARLLASGKGQIESADLENSKEPKNCLPSSTVDEESNWVGRLRLIRELHAVALVSISETLHTERIFGLSTQPTAKPTPRADAADDPEEEPLQAAARQKLRYLMTAIGKDELKNTFKSKGSEDNPFPSLKVKIVANGEVITNDEYVETVGHAIADHGGKSLKVKILCGGKPITNEKVVPPVTRAIALCKEEQDVKVKIVCDGEEVFGDMNAVRTSNQQSEEVRKMYRGQLSRVVRDHLAFSHGDYDGNEALVKFFFGRPGRMNPCARCLAYKRSMLVCRVRRAHSNMDFDWIENFRGVGGVDGLIQVLGLDQGELATALATPAGERGDGNNVECEKATDSSQAPDATQDDEQAVADNDHSQVVPSKDEAGGEIASASGLDDNNKEDDDDAEDSTDPHEHVEKAETALALSKRVLQEAQVYAQAPARLSRDFVESTVPVDPSDGHYVYCIICGLSGDLLCCDGCSNVVHSKCIGLSDVPEGDWFCEECTMNVSGYAGRDGDDSGTETRNDARDGKEDATLKKDGRQSTADESKNVEATAVPSTGQPFGRLEFDQEKADELSSLLDELHTSRPENARKKMSHEAKKTQDDAKSKHEQEKNDDDGRAERRLNKPKVVFKDDLSDFDEDSDEVEVAADSDEDDFVPSGVARRNRKNKLDKSRTRSPRRKLSGLNDPFETLSAVTQSFLSSIGITNAEDFLSSRTTDIGQEFVKWRKKEGLAELKGMGEIASVSTWKAACRKAATAMGLDDIASLEPNDRSRSSGKAKTDGNEHSATTRRSGRHGRAVKRESRGVRGPKRRGRKRRSRSDTDDSEVESRKRRGRPKKRLLGDKVEHSIRGRRRKGSSPDHEGGADESQRKRRGRRSQHSAGNESEDTMPRKRRSRLTRNSDPEEDSSVDAARQKRRGRPGKKTGRAKPHRSASARRGRARQQSSDSDSENSNTLREHQSETMQDLNTSEVHSVDSESSLPRKRGTHPPKRLAEEADESRPARRAGSKRQTESGRQKGRTTNARSNRSKSRTEYEEDDSGSDSTENRRTRRPPARFVDEVSSNGRHTETPKSPTRSRMNGQSPARKTRASSDDVAMSLEQNLEVSVLSMVEELLPEHQSPRRKRRKTRQR